MGSWNLRSYTYRQILLTCMLVSQFICSLFIFSKMNLLDLGTLCRILNHWQFTEACLYWNLMYILPWECDKTALGGICSLFPIILTSQGAGILPPLVDSNWYLTNKVSSYFYHFSRNIWTTLIYFINYICFMLSIKREISIMLLLESILFLKSLVD